MGTKESKTDSANTVDSEQETTSTEQGEVSTPDGTPQGESPGVSTLDITKTDEDTVSENTDSSQSNENNEEKDEKDEKEDPVETVYLDDSKVGVRYEDYPLSDAVVKGLSDIGQTYLSRYHQLMLHHLTLGEDRWFSVNLASNRGQVLGAYLVDIAQIDTTKTSVLLCVAVPKIRQYFERDLMSIARYTGVRILCLDESPSDTAELDEVPNIIIASIQTMQTLSTMLDFSNIEVCYCDEVEKSIRDAQDDFISFVNEHSFPQVVLQSSYYSKDLVQSIQQCKPELNPTRIFKHRSNGPDVFVSATIEQQTIVNLYYHALLQRMVILGDATQQSILNALHLDFQRRGIDILDCTSMSESDLQECVDKLRENRCQVLMMSKDQYVTANHVECDIVVCLQGLTGASEMSLMKKYRKLSTLVVLGTEQESFGGVDTHPLEEMGLVNLNPYATITSVLRKNLRTGMQTDWTGVVDHLLSEVDGKQLLGEALRLSLQEKRAGQGLVVSSVYKMEGKDIFQRRNRRNTRSKRR